MKPLITVILLFLFSQIQAQSSAKDIINSTLISNNEDKFDTLFGTIIPKTEAYDNYEYFHPNNNTLDTGSKLKEYILQRWEGTKWDNLRRENYTYNTDGQMVTYLVELHKNGIWQNYSMQTNKYFDNLRTESLFKKWGEPKWENDIKYEFKYDSNNNLIEWSELRYRDAEWKNKYKRTLTYNSNDNVNMSLLQRWIPTYGWVNYEKYTYKYDINDKMIERIWWYNISGNLTKSYRWRYTYDFEGNLVSEEGGLWKNRKWKEDWLKDFYYDKEIYLSEKNDWKESGGFQGYDSLKLTTPQPWFLHIRTNEASEIECTQIACESENGKEFGHYLWLGDDYENSEERYKFQFYWLSYGKVPFDFERTIEQESKTIIHYGKWDIFENPSKPKLSCERIYNFNEKGNCTEYIRRNDKRVNTNRNITEYDEVNNLISQRMQVWDIIKWEDKNRCFLKYTPVTDVSSNLKNHMIIVLETTIQTHLIRAQL